MRGVQHLVDRTLHTARRRRARERLRDGPAPTSILFICHGNICRSPYAEVAVRDRELLRDRNISLRSAGFIGPDRPSPEVARAVAAGRGVSLEAHRSRLIETEELARPALVVVMDTRQQEKVAELSGRAREEILVLGDLDPRPIRRRAIRDPWGQPEPVFEEVYARIDRCIGELARVLNDTRVSEGA